MKRLSGRQWCGVGILLLTALYFHAVMPAWEFLVLLVLVGVPAAVSAGVVLVLRAPRRAPQDEGEHLGEHLGGVRPPENGASERASR